MLSVVNEDGTTQSGSLIDDIVREGARRMLAAALEDEVNQYIAELADQRDEHGRRLVVRNGHHRERTVTTAAGSIEVNVPRVNDKRTDETTGDPARWRPSRTRQVRGTDDQPPHPGPAESARTRARARTDPRRSSGRRARRGRWSPAHRDDAARPVPPAYWAQRVGKPRWAPAVGAFVPTAVPTSVRMTAGMHVLAGQGLSVRGSRAVTPLFSPPY